MSDGVLRYVERNKRWSDNARRKKIGGGALSSFEGTRKCFAQLCSEYHAVRRDEAIKRCTLKTTQKQSNVNFTIHIDSVNNLMR